jgi:hypothetical protein
VTPLENLLSFPKGALRYPGRHEVVEAVYTADGAATPVVVKKVRLSGGRDRAAESLAVARALLARGVDTPEPLAAGRVGAEGWFVARRLEGAEQIRKWFLARDGAAGSGPALPYSFEEVASALARLARRLHESGVFFRDFTDGNVLVTRGDAGPRLWLVDLDRARVGETPVPAFRRWRDLARPGLNRRADLKFFLSKYFEPDPVPAAAAVAVPLLRRRIVLWDDLKAAARPWRK